MRYAMGGNGVSRKKVISMHSANVTVQCKLVMSTVGTEGAVVGALS